MMTRLLDLHEVPRRTLLAFRVLAYIATPIYLHLVDNIQAFSHTIASTSLLLAANTHSPGFCAHPFHRMLAIHTYIHAVYTIAF